MTDDGRERVLRMVASGRLTAEEAAKVLDALEPPRSRGSVADVQPPIARAPGRSLVIRIEEEGNSRVNIRIPLGLARGAGKLLPRRVQEHVEDNYDIKLTDLLSDIGTATSAGPLIDIQDNRERVYIAVE